MNQVPELICDILYYMSGFIHYRTDQMSAEAYKHLLTSQVSNTQVNSNQQNFIYETEGWKHDQRGIEKRLEEYLAF